MKKIFLVIFFISFLFPTSFVFAFSLNELFVTSSLPEFYNFLTDSEKKLYDNLPDLTKQKFIQIYNYVKQKNTQSSNQTTNTNPICNYDANGNLVTADPAGKTVNTSGCPTVPAYANSIPLSSNAPTPQTPFYNPQTGQYQNTPAAPAQNPYLTGVTNPYAQPAAATQPAATAPAAQPTRSVDTSLAANTPNGTCPTADGVTWVHTGIETCPDDVGPDETMKATLIDACQKLRKPIIARTIYRPSNCNSGAENSNHLRGRAIDLFLRKDNNPNNLDEKEAVILLQTFKSHGFTGYGCYPNSGPNYVHLSISSSEHYGSSCPPELDLSGYKN